MFNEDVYQEINNQLERGSGLCQIGEEVANRLAERFNCQCIVEHAAFNNVNWTETERYTRVFARYFVRVLRNEAGHA